ncbi:putative DNA double-strand break repair Rad50 ATPase [Gossypium australe]|uniref:Putative DNA double-strand break repair Rad50 ATPase n=1 Tax=Gossypium australe TaxID=47621 RepID=A0A5B6X418_9ROSI|nr:putative DNA double-strand break repair Rad50 ATPase [Gossypium australe]
MDQRLEWLKQIQKEIQDQLQMQLQEQLAKVQQDMRDQIQEYQRSMISQLTQLLARGLEKGKCTVANSGYDNEDPIYPPGFTSKNVQTQPEAYPRRVPITIRPQQFQVGTSVPMNYQTGLGSNPGDNPTKLVFPDLDDMAEMEKTRVELPNAT